MKKVALLLSAMFLFGCGSSGSGTSSTPEASPILNTNSGGQPAQFSLTLQDSGATSTGKVMAMVVGPSATANKARIVVRQFNTVSHHDLMYTNDEEGNVVPTDPVQYNDYNTYTETYRRVVDAAIDNGTVTFLTPVSVGNDVYEFDVLTYVSGTPNMITRFGTVNNVTVAAGASATVAMTNISATVTDTIPSFSIKSDSLFKITFTSALNSPFRRNYDFAATTPSNLSVKASGIEGGVLTVKAPLSSNLNDTTLNFSATFYIADTMLDPNNTADKYSNFVCTLTDSAVFAPMASVTQEVQ